MYIAYIIVADISTPVRFVIVTEEIVKGSVFVGVAPYVVV
jgi:hypothetical protein